MYFLDKGLLLTTKLLTGVHDNRIKVLNSVAMVNLLIAMLHLFHDVRKMSNTPNQQPGLLTVSPEG
jgi:hypothetical protein